MAAYLVFGWLVLQIADVLFPALHLPEWTITLISVLLAMGFIPALIVSWVYELTPDGLKRESEVDRSQSLTRETSRRLDLITIGMLVLVLAVILVDRTLLEGHVEDRGAATSVSQAADEEAATDAGPHDYAIAVLAFEDLSDTQDLLTHIAARDLDTHRQARAPPELPLPLGEENSEQLAFF